MKLKLLMALLVVTFANIAMAESKLNIALTVPEINENPYFRPYVAVWLEDTERNGIETLALWYQVDLDKPKKKKGRKWLKDLRQWWRKLGRKADPVMDGITGATRKPGKYVVEASTAHLAEGEYLLNIEASREDGGRSYQRIPITLGEASTSTLAADGELGEIIVTVEI